MSGDVEHAPTKATAKEWSISRTTNGHGIWISGTQTSLPSVCMHTVRKSKPGMYVKIAFSF